MRTLDLAALASPGGGRCFEGREGVLFTSADTRGCDTVTLYSSSDTVHVTVEGGGVLRLR